MPRHATFYVQRPMPARFRAGYTLSAGDVEEIERLLARRDRWIQFYQAMELELSGMTANLTRQLLEAEQSARVPMTGYIRQEGQAAGFYTDQWTEPVFRMRVRPIEPVSAIELNGYRPEGSQPGQIRVRIDGHEVAKAAVQRGPFTVRAAPRSRATQPFEVEVTFEGPRAPAAGDERNLAWLLLNVNARHAGAAVR